MAMLNVERESGDTQRTSDAQNTPDAIVSERFSKLLSKAFWTAVRHADGRVFEATAPVRM